MEIPSKIIVAGISKMGEGHILIGIVAVREKSILRNNECSALSFF